MMKVKFIQHGYAVLYYVAIKSLFRFSKVSAKLQKPPLCKGRWLHAVETEGLYCEYTFNL